MTIVSWRLAEEDPPEASRCIELGAFMRRMHPAHMSSADERGRIFRWKLLDNAAHPGFASFMIAEPDDSIVSLCTVTPKRLWYQGAVEPWAEIGDTFTDEAYQRKGMFAAVTDASRRRAQAAGFAIVFGLPNDQSLPPYTQKLNFGVKADVDQVEDILILTTRVVASRLRRRGWRIAAGVLEWPMAVGLSRIILHAAHRPGASPGAVAVQEEEQFGADYDGLWQRVAPDLPVAQVRDARYLTWRYAASPFDFRVLAARQDGALVGYLVILVPPADHASALRYMYIMDWLFPVASGKLVGAALMKTVIQLAAEERVDVVAAHTARRSPLTLPWPKGRLRRPVGKPVIIHRSPTGEQLIADPAPWHLTLSDTDAF